MNITIKQSTVTSVELSLTISVLIFRRNLARHLRNLCRIKFKGGNALYRSREIVSLPMMWASIALQCSQGSTYWIFCCSSFTIVFHDIGFINHHYFVFGSSEVLLFKLWTKLCSNHKGDSNNTILLKTFMKTHISRTINLTFNAKQPGDMR